MLLLAILIGVALLVLAVKRSKPVAPRTKSPPRPAPPARPGSAPAAGQAARFDAASAEPVARRTELEGAAYVVDGDTLVIRKTQIRLFGVDAPELNHPYGKKAKWALVSLCKGQTVHAELVERDAHGRTVARCHLPDGRDLSAEMVKLGLAIDWAKFSGGVYRSLETQDARRRLWLADARQKGRMHVWEAFEARQRKPATNK